MKVRYYTEKSLIEENAKNALILFENETDINNISVFPDIHYCSERSIPVGVAFKTTDFFYPLVTGKDMGCGVAFMRIPKQNYHTPFDKVKHYRAFDKEAQQMTDEGLGGGNHFLSLEESDKFLYIIIHTGSRNLGIYMYQKNYGLIQENGFDNKLPISIATEAYQKDYNRILKYSHDRRMEFLEKTRIFLVKNKYIDDKSYFISDSCHNYLEFTNDGVIHRKGSTGLVDDNEIVIPLSMSRGSLIVKPDKWSEYLKESIYSCSHGAGRKLSRTDTLKYWHSMKKSQKAEYKKAFSEALEKNGEFSSSIIQEFDFAYKTSDDILQNQPHLIKTDETKPVVTIKFTGI